MPKAKGLNGGPALLISPFMRSIVCWSVLFLLGAAGMHLGAIDVNPEQGHHSAQLVRHGRQQLQHLQRRPEADPARERGRPGGVRFQADHFPQPAAAGGNQGRHARPGDQAHLLRARSRQEDLHPVLSHRAALGFPHQGPDRQAGLRLFRQLRFRAEGRRLHGEPRRLADLFRAGAIRATSIRRGRRGPTPSTPCWRIIPR